MDSNEDEMTTFVGVLRNYEIFDKMHRKNREDIERLLFLAAFNLDDTTRECRKPSRNIKKLQKSLNILLEAHKKVVSLLDPIK